MVLIFLYSCTTKSKKNENINSLKQVSEEKILDNTFIKGSFEWLKSDNKPEGAKLYLLKPGKPYEEIEVVDSCIIKNGGKFEFSFCLTKNEILIINDAINSFSIADVVITPKDNILIKIGFNDSENEYASNITNDISGKCLEYNKIICEIKNKLSPLMEISMNSDYQKIIDTYSIFKKQLLYKLDSIHDKENNTDFYNYSKKKVELGVEYLKMHTYSYAFSNGYIKSRPDSIKNEYLSAFNGADPLIINYNQISTYIISALQFFGSYYFRENFDYYTFYEFIRDNFVGEIRDNAIVLYLTRFIVEYQGEDFFNKILNDFEKIITDPLYFEYLKSELININNLLKENSVRQRL